MVVVLIMNSIRKTGNYKKNKNDVSIKILYEELQNNVGLQLDDNSGKLCEYLVDRTYRITGQIWICNMYLEKTESKLYSAYPYDSMSSRFIFFTFYDGLNVDFIRPLCKTNNKLISFFNTDVLVEDPVWNVKKHSIKELRASIVSSSLKDENATENALLCLSEALQKFAGENWRVVNQETICDHMYTMFSHRYPEQSWGCWMSKSSMHGGGHDDERLVLYVKNEFHMVIYKGTS